MIRRIVKIIKNRALVTIPVCLFGFLLTYTNTVRAECNIADLDNSTAGVIQAYLAYYGRVPDAGGYEFWKMELENNGNDFSAISTIFGESKEFSDRFGDLDGAELVEQLYQWLFNRAPDDAGFAFWQNQLDSGQVTYAEMALAVLRGATGRDLDYIDGVTALVFQVVRQGPPDYRSPSELEVWSEVSLLLNFYDNDLEAACSRVNLALTENRRFLPLDPDVTEMYLKNFELWRSLPNRDNYIATLALYCFCTVSGNITVHVENGTVVAIEDTDTGEPYGEFGVADAITLENMLTIAEAAVVGEARYYSIEFDENTGFPVDFSIDYSLSIADDEIGWTVFDIEFTSP